MPDCGGETLITMHIALILYISVHFIYITNYLITRKRFRYSN